MRKGIAFFLIAVLLFSCGASRREPVNSVDTSQMQKMYTTAYCLHGVTATGGTTRPGIAACNTHLGEIALLYTTSGEYLGMYEITDTGSTKGLQKGNVIDVWRSNYTQCQSWMSLTNGKVYVKWVKGVG